MRQGGPSSGRRPRGRHHGGGGGHGGGGHSGGSHHGNGNNSGPVRDNRPRTAASLRHQTFDSNCIDVRVRGNAWQVHEKYQALARDATASGDRVAAENYMQHAEHYYRIIEAINEATAAEQRTRGGPAVPFNQQPEVPQNYYGTDGNQQPAPPPGAPGTEGNVAGQPAPQAQAEVQKRTPASPFFTPEEIEEQQQQQGGTEPLTARR